MRVLLIMDPGIPVPPQLYGGIERIVYLLANEYQKLGHEVTLLAGPDSFCNGNTKNFGVNRLARSKWQRFKEILFVWKYLVGNKNKFDLVHNFGRLIYLLPVLNSDLKKIMSYQRQVSTKGIKRITSLPNKNIIFTGCSNYCVSTGNIAGTWATVHNAIDFSQYQLNETLSKNAPLMFLGRLDRVKGLHTAIKAAKATGRTLLIGGNIPDTADNHAYYKTEIEPLIDDKQIKYLGPLTDTDKNNYLKQSEALLFPIQWDEPFGIVMIESMACGTPVIGFKRGSVPEVIEDGITGYITSDVVEMIAAIETLSSFDRLACRNNAESRFNINKIALQYLNLFQYD